MTDYILDRAYLDTLRSQIEQQHQEAVATITRAKVVVERSIGAIAVLNDLLARVDAGQDEEEAEVVSMPQKEARQ